jgi:hypothetical protein
MIVLVGSAAAKLHISTFRDPGDFDLIMPFPTMLNFIEDHSIVATPLSPTKFISKWFGHMLEIEVAWPGSTAESLLKVVHGEVMDYMGQPLMVPHLDWLYTIKMSHRFKKNDPHFRKTMRDIHLMREHGAKVIDAKWLAAREKETYTKPRPKLNVSKHEFFANGEQKYPFDHDSIHEAVKHLDRPAYEYYKGDGEEVMCSRAKWEELDDRVKIFGVLEECYVLALERSQIPFTGKISASESFMIALEKVCTSITSGWFRRFAWENYHRVKDAYSDEYIQKFLDGLHDGTVKLVREEDHEIQMAQS